MRWNLIWRTLRRFVFSFISSDLVAYEDRECDRNGLNSTFFYCTERTPPPNLKYTVQIFFEDMQSIV